MDCLLTFFIVSFEAQKFVSFDEVKFTYFFSLIACAFGITSNKKSLLKLRLQRFTSTFSSNRFTVLALTLTPMIHSVHFYLWHEEKFQLLYFCM